MEVMEVARALFGTFIQVAPRPPETNTPFCHVSTATTFGSSGEKLTAEAKGKIQRGKRNVPLPVIIEVRPATSVQLLPPSQVSIIFSLTTSGAMTCAVGFMVLWRVRSERRGRGPSRWPTLGNSAASRYTRQVHAAAFHALMSLVTLTRSTWNGGFLSSA
jgi:hypothetical protein